jgi:hypothetical protein
VDNTSSPAVDKRTLASCVLCSSDMRNKQSSSRTSKKLSFEVETVRVLSAESLDRIAGGAAVPGAQMTFTWTKIPDL